MPGGAALQLHAGWVAQNKHVRKPIPRLWLLRQSHFFTLPFSSRYAVTHASGAFQLMVISLTLQASM